MVPDRHLQGEHRLATSNNGHGNALLARTTFEPGEVLVRFRLADLVPAPVRHSIQVGVAAHALVDPECLRYMNHSCDPNVVLDTSAQCILALRRIAPGEEITYFYPSTEWSMAEPFDCHCRSEHCVGRIAGAAHLPAGVLDRYRLAAHIAELLATHGAQRQG